MSDKPEELERHYNSLGDVRDYLLAFESNLLADAAEKIQQYIEGESDDKKI